MVKKTISDYMTKNIIKLPCDTLLLETIEVMRMRRVGSVLLEEQGTVVGIFTERDMLTRIDFSEPGRLAEIAMREVMTGNLMTVPENESFIKVIDMMEEHKIRHMPVINDAGEVVGIVSLRDLLHHYQEHLEHLLMLKEQELNENLKKIKESEELFRTIFTHSPVAITLTDKDERIIAWNPFTKYMLGWEDADLLNRPVKDLYPPEEWTKIRSRNIRQIGVMHRLETRAIRKRGKLLDIDLSICVLKNSSGKIIGSIGIMKDITAHKLAGQALAHARDQALHASRLKARFLADMSHEIRNPLNAIVGFSRLLDKTTLDEKQREYLGAMLHSSEMLLAILCDVLDISKIESGEMSCEQIEFDLEHVVKATVEVARGKVEDKPVELDYVYDSKVPAAFCGDPTKIRQIIMNLLSNAVKFTDEGTVTVLVNQTNEEVPDLQEGRCKLLISVKDTGAGIPPEAQEKIFETFEQADASTTRKYGGSGLGLSISKALVELMGGQMWVESEMGKGSEFFFTVVLDVIDPERVKKDDVVLFASGSDVFSSISGSQVSILVAEDNVINQQLYREVISKFGCKVDIVSNGQEAVESLKQNTYELILMDLQMPVMDGYDAASVIRKELEIKTPIIALTANALEGEQDKCFSVGMNDYITKPVDLEKLKEKLIRWSHHE